MYTIKFFCHHPGVVHTMQLHSTLGFAQKEWDRLEFKRSTYMHTARPA